MPKIEAAERRDARRDKERRGMQVTNRSLKTIQAALAARVKRGKEATIERH